MKSNDLYFYDWFQEYFGFGYGTGDEVMLKAVYDFIVDVCTQGRYDYRDAEKLLGPTVTWLLINTLCDKVIEYGTSPRFGWLTKSGCLIRDYLLLSMTFAEVLAKYEECYQLKDYYSCSPQYCNCDDVYVEGRKCENPFWERGWNERR